MHIEPHITRDWDEHWNPVCIADCPRCRQERNPVLRVAFWLWFKVESYTHLIRRVW
jgi:hypothetical protein